MNLSYRSSLVAVVLLGLAFASTVQANTPGFDYETTIPGYYLSRGLDMTVDTDGNAFVIASWYQDQQHLDFLVIKLDDKGTVLWTVPIVGDQLEHDFPTDITYYKSGSEVPSDPEFAGATSYVKTLIPGGRGFMGGETYGNRRKG